MENFPQRWVYGGGKLTPKKDTQKKWCYKCEDTKDKEEFYPGTNICKKCGRDRCKDYKRRKKKEGEKKDEN